MSDVKAVLTFDPNNSKIVVAPTVQLPAFQRYLSETIFHVMCSLHEFDQKASMARSRIVNERGSHWSPIPRRIDTQPEITVKADCATYRVGSMVLIEDPFSTVFVVRGERELLNRLYRLFDSRELGVDSRSDLFKYELLRRVHQEASVSADTVLDQVFKHRVDLRSRFISQRLPGHLSSMAIYPPLGSHFRRETSFGKFDAQQPIACVSLQEFYHIVVSAAEGLATSDESLSAQLDREANINLNETERQSTPETNNTTVSFFSSTLNTSSREMSFVDKQHHSGLLVQHPESLVESKDNLLVEKKSQFTAGKKERRSSSDDSTTDHEDGQSGDQADKAIDSHHEHAQCADQESAVTDVRFSFLSQEKQDPIVLNWVTNTSMELN